MGTARCRPGCLPDSSGAPAASPRWGLGVLCCAGTLSAPGAAPPVTRGSVRLRLVQTPPRRTGGIPGRCPSNLSRVARGHGGSVTRSAISRGVWCSSPSVPPVLTLTYFRGSHLAVRTWDFSRQLAGVRVSLSWEWEGSGWAGRTGPGGGTGLCTALLPSVGQEQLGGLVVPPVWQHLTTCCSHPALNDSAAPTVLRCLYLLVSVMG